MVSLNKRSTQGNLTGATGVIDKTRPIIDRVNQSINQQLIA
jgi:hypothetical protein